MTKQVMGVPSLKPENLAAQSFFRSFLNKYTKLDDKVRTINFSNTFSGLVKKPTQSPTPKTLLIKLSTFKPFSTFYNSTILSCRIAAHKVEDGRDTCLHDFAKRNSHLGTG